MKNRWVSFLLMVMVLASTLAAGQQGQQGKGKGKFSQEEILIKFKDGVTDGQVEKLKKKHRLKKIKHIKKINVHKLKLPEGMSVEDAIILLKSDPLVDYVEPNYSIELFSGLTLSAASAAFEARYGKISKKEKHGLKTLAISDKHIKTGSPKEIAQEVIESAGSLLDYDPVEIIFFSEKESLSGRHVRYYQTYRGIPIYGTMLSVHLDKKNRVRLLQSRTRKAGVVSTKPTILALVAMSRTRQELGSPETWKQGDKPRLMIFSPPSGETSLVWRIELKRSSPPASWEILVDAHDGEILLKRNRVAQFGGTGNVFDPNPTRRYEALGFQPPATPLPTHGTDICPDQSPPDATDLTPYVSQAVSLTGLDGSGFLQNSFIKVVNTKYDGVAEQSNPDYATLNSVASSPTHQFEYAYNDSQGRFEETMAYYHLQNYRNRLKTTLGYGGIGLLDSQIFIDVHQVNSVGDDLTGAFTNPPDEIIIGDNHSLDVTRCRELAEEGDALIHEYAGHILYADIHPAEFLFNPGFEEGWSDFLMASYFDDPVVGEWSDEINAVGYRRNLKNQLTLLDWQVDVSIFGAIYPAAHDNGEIWGGTLWEIREALMGQFVGGSTTRADIASLMDTLVIEGLYFFSPPSFSDYFATGSYSQTVAWDAARDALLTALSFLAVLDPGDPRYDARYAQIDTETLLAEFCKRELCTAVPDDPYFGADWTLQRIQATEAWSIQTGRSDVVVGVIDMAMAWNHADFGSDMFAFETAGDFTSRMIVQNAVGNRGNLWVNETELAGVNNLIDDDLNNYEDDFIGWDFAADHNNPWNSVFGPSHGTMVAGVIGAKGNDAVGTTGVNWDVSLMFLNMASLDASVSQTSDAQLYAVIKSARIVNASWGIIPFGAFSQTLFDAVSVASDQGILFVAAAGNTGQVGWSDLDQNPLYPQKYILPNIILVTALNNLEEQEEVYGRYTVDLGAPTGKVAPAVDAFDQTDNYDTLGKTSGATPHVTGAIALLLAEEKDRIDANPGYRTMGMGEIRYLLLTSVDRLSSLVDITVSEGRLNVYKLLLNYEDSDMDGYADRIEALFDTNPYDGSEMPDLAADDDGDGLSNGDELAYGTLPRIPNGDLTELLYPIYLEHDIAGNLTGNLLPAIVSQDSDNDGLNDSEETVSGADLFVTDPANPDSDSDGFNDSLDNCPIDINPGQENNDGDTQGDVCDPDDDNDGVSDIEEISAGTDPNVFADTDLDRMSDDWETIRGTNVALDDALDDPDGDGFVNVLEYLRNTLPLDANSVPVINTIFVDQSNSSGIEYGTAANPFSTIAVALTAAQDGDTLQLAAGNYVLGFFPLQKPVRMVGAGTNATTLSATYFLPSLIPWAQIEDLTISASYSNFLSTARNVLYKNCRISAAQGSDLQGNSKAVFQNCVLDGGVGTGTGINLNADGDAVMINSTLVDYAIGISLQSTDSELSIRNSVLANNTVDLSGVTDGSGISYSLISDGQFTGSSGNISGDPLFSDPDYRLAVGSPGIDAGDPADDFSNEPVPSGCLINIGAYGNTSQAAASSDPDPDEDGLTDRCETLAGTDPGNPDTDNDGLKDGIEDTNGNGVVDAGETDPLNPDTDGDGYNDGYEVAAGSDPLDPASVPTIPNGDINGDGQVNAADILLAQQALLGQLILSPEQFLRGDVAPLMGGVPSPDGVFDLGDVLIISRKALGQVNF